MLILKFLLQSLESLQDGEHEKQRRHFLYFLLHQVTQSRNFSNLMRKNACKVSLSIRLDVIVFVFCCIHSIIWSNIFIILIHVSCFFFQIALLIIQRGYSMNPPCPPFECAHMW